MIRKARDLDAATALDNIFREYTAKLRGAFTTAAQQARDSVSRTKLAALLNAGDVDGAIALVERANLPGLLQGIGLAAGTKSTSDLIRDVYLAGGVMGARQLPKRVRDQATLDPLHPRAVEWMRTRIGELVTDVTQEQREAIRTAVVRAFGEGRTGYQTAVEIREIVGLTEQQTQAVANFRRQLETKSTGTGTVPWERRLSATEQAMTRAEFKAPTVSRAKVDDLVDRYSQRLLNRRAENIARTEIHNAAIQGQAEQWRQAVEQGLLAPEKTRRVWIITPDKRLRDSHESVPRMNEGGVPLEQPFDTPIGPLMHPGEGPPGWVVNCRCAEGLRFD